MKISNSYDKAEDVPQEFKDSFTEVEGKFVMTSPIDIKTDAEFEEVKKAKQHAFDEMHQVKEQLKVESQKALEATSKNEVLELQIKDGADPAKLQELVDTKIKVATEELTKQLGEANEKNASFQNTIYGSELNDVVGGMAKNFSDSVQDEANFILKSIMVRGEDGRHLSKEAFNLPAGLEPEQVVSKLTELRPNWQKGNTADNASGGGNGTPQDKRAKFNDLLKKRQGGETLNRQESIELSTLANNLKNEE